MADDFESDTGVGFKRSISGTQLPLSPLQKSPGIGSDTGEGALTVRHGSGFDLESFNKKAKRYSYQENQDQLQFFVQGVEEKQGNEEVKLDHKRDDDAMKVNDDTVRFSNFLVHSPVVGENDNDNDLSGIQESAGEINKSSYPGLRIEQVDHKCDDDAMKMNDDKVGISNSLFHSSVVGENDDSLSGIHESAGEINKSLYPGLRVEQVKMDSAGSISGLAESISNSRSHVVSFTGECIVLTKGKHNDRNSKANSGNQSGLREEVKCALKIQVIDDTALIGSLYASKVGKHLGTKGIKKNMNQEKFGNEKKSRRRGKNLKKYLGTNGNEKIVEAPQKKADVEEEEKKWCYKRKEMNGLRFSNVEEQSKKWIAKVEEEEKKKWGYTRKEMDALRFSNVEEEQSKKWIANVEEEGKKKWGYTRKEMDVLRFSNVEEQSKKWIANVEEEEKKKKWVYTRKEMDALRFSNVEEESKKWIANVEEVKKEKWSYTRKEMEALRFANVEEQKKKWTEIYCGFGPSVTKEYHGLLDCNNHQKHIQVNFDPRPLLRRKDAAPPILSWVAAKERANHLKFFGHREMV